MGALVWVRLERPHAFRRARDTFVVAQLMTVVVTLCLPVAPPRMLPDLGFRDLLAATYGSGGEALAHSLQSPLAAMPSGHIVFAAFSGGVVAALARPWWARAAAIVYPLLVVAAAAIPAPARPLQPWSGSAPSSLSTMLTPRRVRGPLRGRGRAA